MATLEKHSNAQETGKQADQNKVLPRVLFIDDDERLLNACRRVFRKHVDLVTVDSGQEALDELCVDNDYTVIVCDQNMPGLKGTDVLKQAASKWPHLSRIMLTGNADQHTAVLALNECNVFRFINKPSEPSTILAAIREAHQKTLLARQEAQLLEETLSASMEMLMDVITLNKPDLAAKAQQLRSTVNILTADMRADRAWELEMATILWPISQTIVSEGLQATQSDEAGAQQERAAMLQAARQTTRDMIASVPRLEGVATALTNSYADYRDLKDQSGPSAGQMQENAFILRILIDFCDKAENDVAPDMIAESARATLDQMRKDGEGRLYDPKMLMLVRTLLPPQLEKAHQHRDEICASIGALQVGDQTQDDIVDSKGTVLLRKGATLSQPLIDKLRMLEKARRLSGKITVSRLEFDNPENDQEAA